MKKKYIIIPLIVAVLAVGGYFLLRGKKDPVQTIDVTKKDLAQTVSVTGEIKTDSEINLNFEIAGRVKSVLAEIGQEAARGEELAQVEDNNLSQEVNNAKAALDKAIAQSGISNDEISRLETEVRNAEKYLKDAEELEEQKADASKQEIEDEERYYDDAVAYYNKIVSEEGENSAEAKYAELTVDTARGKLNSAKEAKKTTEKSKELSITSAENNVRTAKENLLKAKSANQALFNDAAVSSAQAQYQIAANNLEKTTLKAPVSGIITKLNYETGEIIGTSNVNPFATMLSKDLLIEANVPESDISKVKIGNQGKVTFDSLSEEEQFVVEVVSIEPAATLVQDVVYYLVKFRLDNLLDNRLKPGMTANVDIETNKKNNILVIPERLVREENNKRYVTVLRGEQQENAEIRTGIRGDEGFIEVLSGLKEGDKLVAQ